jgi:Xaa-Pro aminopeptidase
LKKNAPALVTPCLLILGAILPFGNAGTAQSITAREDASPGSPDRASAQEDVYSARRQALSEFLDEGFAVLFSEAPRGDFNKDFFYLTGIREAGAVLALFPGGDVEEVLFNRTGEWPFPSPGSGSAAHRREDLPRQLPMYARGLETAYVPFGSLEALPEVGQALSRVSTIRNVENALAEMRAIKDPLEIHYLEEACEITAQGLSDVFRAMEPGMQEEDLGLLLEFGFKMRKSPGYSFLQAASGPNSTNVHFGAGERIIEDGDIIVFDVGAVWNDYTADISRTVPANGRFTEAQREIYTVVLNAQKAGIDRMKPGARMSDVRRAAEDALIDGLYELGLILDRDDPAQRRFFIVHGFFHFIGLDIHDVWSVWGRLAGERSYEPGMVMTMEPGLYFPRDGIQTALDRLGEGEEDAQTRAFLEALRPVYQRYVDIGVRIEDDILITDNGNEILTAGVPKEIQDIEALMAETSPLTSILEIR